jgi:phosphoglucomutase
MKIDWLAGKKAIPEMLANIPGLVSAYYTGIPDPELKEQRIVFGTSGHRGSSLKNSFNENHILAITQSICLFRKQNKIDGPLFLGMDTHALSIPAFNTAMEVLAANEVEVMIAGKEEYTPTPVISHAILNYNASRTTGFSDGIVITPSHNPPEDGGFKYNPPNGGPAGTTITSWIEKKANELLANNLKEVKRISFEKAILAITTHNYDYLNSYVNDLGTIIDMKLLSNSKIRMGVDPLGGAGVHYWEPIAEHYKLDLTVVNKVVDPTFRFMTVDSDGKIRMDPSSSFAMQGLIGMKDQFDISFACDTDHDRHGIVTKSSGLMNPNHYLSAAVFYLIQHRPVWKKDAAFGKTIVTTKMIDRIIARNNRRLIEMPVGFKWFSDGLFDSSFCFAGEESAGATFSRMDGSVWTTDKDGFIPALLSAEITAKTERDPGEIYKELTEEFGEAFYDRVEEKATAEEKEKFKNLSASQLTGNELAGEKIKEVITNAPGNNSPIGGIKVVTENGWFAARPSGTEDVYKIYAESFLSNDHLKKIIGEARDTVNVALKKRERTI